MIITRFKDTICVFRMNAEVKAVRKVQKLKVFSINES